MKTKASWYGADGEKLNTHVSMLASEVCPECKGKCGLQKELNPVLGRIEIHEYCLRCRGDGYLTNPVKFIPESLTCASNTHPLGTWLRVKRIKGDCKFCTAKEICASEDDEGYELCKFQSEGIIVLCCDRGPSKELCECGHRKDEHSEYSDRSIKSCDAFKCECPDFKSRENWIDLSRGAFKKLAPLDVGWIEVEVEVL